MVKTKRVKPKPTVVMRNLSDVDAALGKIAGFKRQLAEIDAELNEKVSQLKQGRDAKAALLLKGIEQLENGIFAYAEYDKEELFKHRKSRDLVCGTIGYRQSTRISVGRKTLSLLEELQFDEAIIVHKKPNRDVMLQWPDDKLMAVGAKRVIDDKFWYELKGEDFVEKVAQRK